LIQRKKEGRLLIRYAFRKKTDDNTGKEEINVFYKQEKGGVDSHDQMCSLYTNAKKKTDSQRGALTQ
jgi:hypothetical protein